MKHTTFNLVRRRSCQFGLILIAQLSVSKGNATPDLGFNERKMELNSIESTPAKVKKASREDVLVYSFPALSMPSEKLLENNLERFKNVDGFVSLTVNADNQVELITESTLSEKESGHLLAISTRMYGYIGFNITE